MFLVQRVADLETLVTANDKEALILENNLIKQYKPRYNIRLKDDKSYPYIAVTVEDDFPRVMFTREHELTAIPLEMEERLTQRAVFIGGASVNVRGQGPGFSSGFGSASMASYRIRVMGYSFSGVEQMAIDLKERLERIPRVRNVDISTASGFMREKATGVTIEPDRAALARFGLTSLDLSAAISREMRTSVGAQMLEIGGDEIPVYVKAEGASTRSLDELRAALITTPDGGSVPLSSVSLVGERDLLSAIDREDQQYMRTVAYEFRGPNRLAQRTHDAFMKSVTPPPGYKVEEAAFSFFTPDDSEKGLWLVFGIQVEPLFGCWTNRNSASRMRAISRRRQNPRVVASRIGLGNARSA